MRNAARLQCYTNFPHSEERVTICHFALNVTSDSSSTKHQVDIVRKLIALVHIAQYII